MFAKILVLFLVLFASTVTLGLAEFTCDTDKPKNGEDATCTCVSQNNIELFAGITSQSTCTTAGACLPIPAGYSFQVNNSNSDVIYKITIQGYASSNCAEYTCKHLGTAVEEKVTLSISDFDESAITANEPGANMDGSINITTDCVFAPSDLTIKWYKVEDGDETEIEADPVDVQRTTCTRTCNSDEDKKVTSGFTHHEYNGSNPVKVVYKVKVTHSSYSQPYEWTSKIYHIEGGTTTSTTSSTSITTNNTHMTLSHAATSTQPSTTNSSTTKLSTKSPNTDDKNIIIGACVGGVAVLVVIISVVGCKYIRKKRENNITTHARSVSNKQLKILKK